MIYYTCSKRMKIFEKLPPKSYFSLNLNKHILSIEQISAFKISAKLIKMFHLTKMTFFSQCILIYVFFSCSFLTDRQVNASSNSINLKIQQVNTIDPTNADTNKNQLNEESFSLIVYQKKLLKVTSISVFQFALNDILFLVPSYTQTNRDCLKILRNNSTSHGQTQSGYLMKIESDDNFSILITDTHYAGKNLKLCYMSPNRKLHDSELFLEINYSSMTLFPTIFNVKHIYQIKDLLENESDDIAVINMEKTWNVLGQSSPGDSAKWILVDMSLGTSPLYSHYDVDSCYNDTLQIGSVSTISTNHTMTFRFDEYNPLSLESSVLFCYKFDNEPFQLYPLIRLQVVQILGLNQTNAITGSSQIVEIYGLGLRENDIVKFIDPDQPSCDTGLPIFTTLVQRIGFPGIMYMNVTFDQAKIGMVVCYQFRSEKYARFDDIQMNSYHGYIQSINIELVNNVKTTVRLYGTFGISTYDELKWVPYESENCSGAPIAYTSSSIAQPSQENLPLSEQVNVSINDENYERETSIEIETRVGISQNTPARLCYKFGTASSFIFFPSVKLYSKQILHLVVDNSMKTIQSSIRIQFVGIGIKSGDRGKFVTNSIENDADCSDKAPIAGSNEFEVDSSGYAMVKFQEPVLRFALCWQFQKRVVYENFFDGKKYLYHPIKLYSKLQVVLAGEELWQHDNIMEGNGKVKFFLSMNTNEIQRNLVDFKTGFIKDMSSILDVKSSRLFILNVEMAHPPIVEMIILPGSHADLLVSEIVDRLTLLLRNINSDIYLLPTSKLSIKNSINIDEQVLIDEVDVDRGTRPSKMAVLSYNENGVFNFEAFVFFTTEKSGVIDVFINRSHGHFGTVVLRYWTTNGTAVSGESYTHINNTIIFKHGERHKNITIIIHDNDETDIHYKEFKIALVIDNQKTLDTMGSYSATVGEKNVASVRIYDYGEGSKAIASTVFPGDITCDPFRSDFRGWTTIGNDDETCLSDDCIQYKWVDFNGLNVIDNIIPEYKLLDDCPEISQNIITPSHINSTYYNLHLDGFGFVKSNSIDFTLDEVTVSFWLKRKLDSSDHVEIILAMTGIGNNNDFELLVSIRQSMIFLLVRDRIIQANKRHDGPKGGDRHGLNLGIPILDELWHHLYISWRSSDGKVKAYKDGSLQFGNTSPYQNGEIICVKNVFVGHLQGRLPENYFGFKGEIESIIISNQFSSEISCVLVTMHIPLSFIPDYMIIVWDFSQIKDNFVKSKSWGKKYDGFLSTNGILVKEGTAPYLYNQQGINIRSCSNIWYYKASSNFTGDLSFAHGGRLQFKLMSPSHSGNVRKRKNFILLKGGNGQVISCPNLFGIPVRGKWTYFSIILREDHGWKSYPHGQSVPRRQMSQILKNVEAILIRGDEWVYGKEGIGKEITILNDIKVYAN